MYKEKLLSFVGHPKTQKFLPILVLLVNILFLIQSFKKAYRDIGYDFTSYLLSSEAFLTGENPYLTETLFPFIYPLFLCIPLIPLTFVPYWLAVFIWFAANLIALFFSAKILLRIYQPSFSLSRVMIFFCLSYILLYGIISSNFSNGQVNMIVLFLCGLFIYYHLKSEKFLASIFLAAAVVAKLTPAVFFIYLLVKGDYKTIFLSILNCIVLAVLLPMLFVGTKVFEFYDFYLQPFLVSRLSTGEGYHGGVSFALLPVVASLLPAVPKFISLFISAILSLAPILLAQWKINKSPAHTNIQELLFFSLYMLSILLISPMSETPHLINMYPAVLVVLCSLVLDPTGRFKISALTAGILFLLLTFGKLISPGFLLAIAVCYLFLLWRTILLRREDYALLKKPLTKL